MYRTTLIVVFLSLFISAETIGIEPESFSKKQHNMFDIGAGIGLDYGGLFGAKFSVSPIPYLSLNLGGGLTVGGFGWATGVKVNILPASRSSLIRLYLQAMYGINGATYVVGKSTYNQRFTGFTPGLGLGFRFGSTRRNGFDVAIHMPIRSNDYQKQIDIIKRDPEIMQFNEPLPIAFAFSYHHEF
jgi:hypothetical protein